MCQRFYPLIVNARLAHFVMPALIPTVAFIPLAFLDNSSSVRSSLIVPSVVAVR